MVRTNLQEFAGDVHVLSNLQVGSNLFANDLAANVLNVIGSIGANLFVGDGGLLSNIATTLDDIIDQGNTVSNTVIFVSGNDATSNTGIITRSNVGISISNTEPTGEYQLTVGSNIFMNTHASNVLTVVGRIGSDYFVGDGGLLSNIATTLDQIVDQGNTISNTVILESGQDSALTSNIGLVSRENVGISVSNSNPTGEFQFGVGSNLFVNTYSSNVLTVEGNVLAQKLTFGTATVTSAYNLSHVTAQGSVTDQTIYLTNATTGLAVTSNATVGGNVTAETVISTANVEVGDRLKFASNVFVDDLRVADVAANLVTYDKTTGELMDSGGLFANKLAVVSVQPPSALSANTTTIAKHGTYTVTTSGLAEYSNAWNAFDGDSAVEWTSPVTYGEGDGVYSGTSNLFAGNYIQTGVSSAGEWLAIEFPYKTTLRHMKLTPPATATSYPTSANVYATNDSLTWTEVVNWSDVNPGDQQSNVQTIIVNATESFKKYAMVATKAVGTTTSVALAKWDLFTESFSIDGGKVEMATSAVMGGETTMDQHGPHGRGEAKLKKYPEIVFDASKLDGNDTANVHTQAGYTVSSSGTSVPGTHDGWKVFDEGDATTSYWHSVGSTYTSGTDEYSRSPASTLGTFSGEWIKLELPHKIKVSRIALQGRHTDRSFGKWYILGSNDDSTWDIVHHKNTTTDNILTTGLSSYTMTGASKDNYYKYFAILGTHIVGDDTQASLGKWELYGYEEGAGSQGDTSVDTTFTSIMNTPQTTGANVYVDGNLGGSFTNRVTGPDVTGTSATYDNTNKYWELNGSLESNIAVEANTFLSGDQPHAVSVWFNSSNLEANVSNTCVFSISDQEKLDSMNLDLQSNTWHNLTYAYQGEGGSRVTYLDGRKVAEDQAEDTFGEYPPFAMTGYAQGGYVVSRSNEYNQSGLDLSSWQAFDNTAGTRWDTANDGNYNSSGVHDGSVTTEVDGTPESGEWIQLEFPHKLRPSHFTLNTNIGTSGSFNYQERAPKTVLLVGSNNGTDWISLFNNTSTPRASTPSTTLVEAFTLSTTQSYKYFRLIVLTTFGGTSGSSASITKLVYYGHRENDLVRLPDPTNVLKYPHIAMTGPAQRGYVASASSNYNNLDRYAGWNAFNETVDDPDGWVSYPGSYSSGTPSTYSGVSQPDKLTGIDATSSGGDTSRNGSWLKIEVPHKLKLSQMKLFRRRSGERIVEGFIYGSNDNSTFYQISNNLSQITNIGTYSNTTPLVINSTDMTTPFKQFVVQVTQNDTTTYTNVGNLELYGTEENSSIPIQIGGGNIDKVANFRVYDKFVGEDQALEIWDAQKDEFGRAKSSMTLQKGRLGIGTTEPEGRLAVLDEPSGLEEFPPRAMTGYKNYFEGHGEFCVSASSELSDTYNIQNVFNKITTIGDSSQAWISGGSPDTFVTSTGLATAENSFEGVNGPWIKLELPYNVKPKKVQMFMRTTSESNSSRRPKSGIVYGRKDGMYHQITNFDFGSTDKDIPLEELNLNTRDYYSEFVLQITSMYLTGASTDAIAIKGINFFGTREQGQSVLHDGQLTLTKSLTVPRIGPALDADDTPRRDRLVVEYNTTTNPTFEGAVRDTSGRGNDGVFYNGASYDATEKALVTTLTDGTQWIETQIPQTGSGLNNGISVSIWAKPGNFDTSSLYGFIFAVGDRSASGNNTEIAITYSATSNQNKYFMSFNGGSGNLNIFNTVTTPFNVLTHVAITYDGTNARLYINGVNTASGTITDVNIPDENCIVRLNGDAVSANSTHQGTPMSLSNFKLYDTALTAEEVKTLYDMGRCDEGHHVVNFSKTRVGIGLGDGEAPRGALDVRDEVYINKQVGPLELRQVVDNTPLQSFIIRAATSGFGYWGMYVTAGNDFSFHQNGSDRGALVSGVNVSAIDFTGQHRNFIDGVSYANYDSLEGLIVSANKNKYYDIDENITAGANAIQISQSLPLVALSNVALDKACFGVISGVEDPDTRKYEQGTFVTVLQKQRGDRRAFINSVGEGAIWVVNTNGSLESGDYITTSNVAGYGQKQNDDVLHNYTVAKITMDCDFEPVTQPVQQILRSNVVETYYLGNVHKVKSVPHEFVTTVVSADDDWSNVSVSPSDVTYAEWSNLEANTQNTYTLTYTQTSNVVYDTKYTLTTTANVTESDAWDRVFIDPPNVSYAEYSNLEANTQNTYTLTFTQTTTDTKTPEEWSALESNTQSLYNKVYYQSVEEEVAATWPGAVAHTRVTDVIENELDEHGQIQWEDHPTDTEKAYKIRYLDASGAQTDSANAVHIAAFVGCTYHCG
jgi:hypothetical protein